MTAPCYSNRTAEREMPPTGRTMGRHRRTNPRHAGGNKAQQHCIETHLHEGMSKLKDLSHRQLYGRICLPEDTKQTVFGRANLAPTD